MIGRSNGASRGTPMDSVLGASMRWLCASAREVVKGSFTAFAALCFLSSAAHALVGFQGANSAQGVTTASSAFNVGKPEYRVDGAGVTSIGVGDLVLAVVTVNSSSATVAADTVGGQAWTTLAGWPRTHGGLRQHVFYRFVTSADLAAANYTFTPSVSNSCYAAAVVAYRGVHATTPIDVTGFATGTPGSAGVWDVASGGYRVGVRAPSISTTVADTRLVALLSVGDMLYYTVANSFGPTSTTASDGWLAPSSPIAMTERADVTATDSTYCDWYNTGNPGASTAIADAPRSATGATGNLDAVANTSALDTPNKIGTLIALRPAAVPNPVARWRFEETTSWSGVAGEIVDDYGLNHATARCDSSIKSGCETNTPRPPQGLPFQSSSSALSGSSALLNPSAYVLFPAASVLSGNAWQYLEVASPNANMNITDNLTVAGFVCRFTNPVHRLALFSHGTRLKLQMTASALTAAWTDSGSTSRTLAQTTSGFAINTWAHVAIVTRQGNQTLYVNGQPVAMSALTTTLQSANPPIHIGADFNDNNAYNIAQGYNMRRQFRGMLDDWRVYNAALSEEDLAALATAAGGSCSSSGHSPGGSVTLNSFTITPAGGAAASICGAKTMTVAANSTGGNWTGTVRVTGPSGATWARLSGGGTFTTNPGGLGNHVFDYTYVAGDANTAQFSMTYGSVGDVSVFAVDNPATVSTANSTLNFRADGTNAFTVSGITTTRTGAPPAAMTTSVGVVGRAHTMRIALNASCGATSTYTGAKTIAIWRVNDGQHPSGANSPSISSVAIPTSESTLWTVAFTNGVADVNISALDVGKYTLYASDATNTWSPTKITTSTPLTLTMRPFGFGFHGVSYWNGTAWIANPGASSASGTAFAPAGASVVMNIRAKHWQSGDDLDNDGWPDSGADLNDNANVNAFAPTTTTLSVVSAVPSGAGTVVGALSGGTTIPSGAWWGGDASSSVGYSEVGAPTVAASSSDYLGTSGANVYATTVVGRFYPADFAVSWNPLEFAVGCGGVTFAGQPFTYASTPIATITARNALGATTVNYGASGWYKLPASTSGTFTAAATPAQTSLSTPAGANVATIVNNGNGTATATLGSGSFAYTRGVGTFAPFAPTFQVTGLTFADTDGITSGAVSTGSFAFAGNAQVRYGRLFVTPSAVSYAPTATATVTVAARHATDTSGSSWADSSDASGCLPALGASNIALVFGGASLSACDSAASAPSAWSSGASTFTMAAPGAGEAGTVVARLNLGVTGGNYCTSKGGAHSATSSLSAGFLLGDLDAGPSLSGDPAGTITYGMGAVTGRRVFVQERF